MKEQDIRRILNEVCDSLDRHRAKLGPMAAGVTMAVLLNCCSPAVSEYGAAMPEDTGSDVTADTPAMHYAAPFDSSDVDSETLAAPPVDAYGALFDVLLPADSSAQDTSDGDATDGDGDAPVDAGAVMRYAVIDDSQPTQNQGG
jgi:hypothetical protein